MNTLRKLISVRIYIVSFFEAVLAMTCYSAAIFLLRPVDAATFLEFEGGAVMVGFLALNVLVVAYLLDFYHEPRMTSRLMMLLDLGRLAGFLFLIQAVLAFVGPDLVLPQPVIFLGSGLLLLVLIPWRLVIRPAIWSAFGAQRVLFIGTGPAVQDLARVFGTEPRLGMAVVGYLLDDPETVPQGAWLGTPEQVSEVMAEHSPDRIVVDNAIARQTILKQLLELTLTGIPVQTASQVYESTFARVDARGLQPYIAVFLDDLKGRPGSVALQSIYTNLLALITIVVALPFILIIAMLLAVTRQGRVFSKQECIGLHGIPFLRYRFHCPTDMSGGPVTYLLKRFRLSGLPQILNVMRGELAMIGPRPERIEFDTVLHELIPFYRQKQAVKPGLFGWSQLHCDTLPDEDTRLRIEYDLYYIKHMSVALDLYIMLRALRWMLAGEPAVVPPAGALHSSHT